MRITTIIPSLMLASALSACSSFGPDYYNCDSIATSYAEGVRSSLQTQEANQDVEVRLNGVNAQCYDVTGSTVAEVSIGMKVARDLAQGSEIDPVVVPMVAAIIDADDTVLETSSFIYTMQFTRGTDTIYPLVRREYTIPQGGRLIVSLTPELLGQ